MSAELSGCGQVRVLMTADAVGGVWRYALDLAQALKTLSVSTTLAVLGPACTEQQREEAAVLDLRVLETGSALDWLCERPEDVKRAAEAVAALARREQADVVQLNGAPLAALSDFAAPVIAVHHSCYPTWWSSVRRRPLPPDMRWRADLVSGHLRAANRVVAPSVSFADQTRAAYALGFRPEVVLNGRSFAGGESGGAYPEVVFTAGRLWDEAKNVATLNRVAARLSAPVFAAGPECGPNGAVVDCEHLHLLGALSENDIRRRLAACPIFASLSLYEPFGLAVLEAAQAGCPLVLSDIPTFRELWSDAALFVAAEDDEAVVSATSKLLHRPELRKSLGAAARTRARRYGIEAAARAMMEIYESLLTSNNVAPRIIGAPA